MRRFLYSILFLNILTFGATALSGKDYSGSDNGSTFTDSINKALDYYLSTYQASQYRDVYKNFMQDFFGPGHILVDTAKAGIYLRQELADSVPFEGPLYEATGYKGNYYRVNLSLIRDSIISYPVFFNAFVESVGNITPPDYSEWLDIWTKIDSIIKFRNIHFPDENNDRNMLSRQLAKGNYVVHHSKRFNESSNFHYRIISHEKFESTILPIINRRYKN